MKRLAVVVLAVVVSLFGGAEPSHAWARGGGGGHSGFRDHHHGFRGSRVFVGAHVFVSPGVFFGAPYWYPYAYPYPAYSPPVVVEAPAPVYAQPQPQQYWYYCQNPHGYYPYVPQCPGGWLQVMPSPAPPTPGPRY